MLLLALLVTTLQQHMQHNAAYLSANAVIARVLLSTLSVRGVACTADPEAFAAKLKLLLLPCSAGDDGVVGAAVVILS